MTEIRKGGANTFEEISEVRTTFTLEGIQRDIDRLKRYVNDTQERIKRLEETKARAESIK